MGIPQLQMTSEFSWDRDIYAGPWCFLCCKPERDVEQTVVWSVKWDSLTSSWYTVIISKSIDQCNGLIVQTEPKQLPKPMATQLTDAYLSLDSDKWNDKRWLGTHKYEIAWKCVLHYFDLHLNKRLNKQPPCWPLNAFRRRQVTVMASRIPANRMFVQIANNEISKVRVTVPLWWESTVTGGSPHKRRVTWKMLLFDDVIMDWRIPWRHMYHITQYTHYITAINQTMLERGRNVVIPLVSLLSPGSIP